MKRRSSPNLQLLCALLLSLAVLPLPAAAGSGCAVAHNLVHCPIGAAQLQAAPDGSQLLVTGLGPAGTDGVATEFDTASHWRAQMSVEEPAGSLTFRALLDGSTTASASFRIEPDTNPFRLGQQTRKLVLETAFTGAAGPHTYRAIVFDDGVQVAVFEDQDESSSIVIGRIPPPEPIPWPGPWPWPDFKRYPTGACAWEFRFAGEMSFTTSAGGQAAGDTIRLVEEVSAGHYLYEGFTAITTQSDAGSLTIDNEEISN